MIVFDTDYLLKVEHWEIAEDVLTMFEATRETCYRLDAAPRMARRKASVKATFSNHLELAERAMLYRRFEDEAPALWLDRMTPHSEIDPGEAELLARLACDSAMFLATSDKRCLRALSRVPGLADAVAGRIVTLEATLLRLCKRLGVTEVRKRVCPRRFVDNGIACCFPQGEEHETVPQLRERFADLGRECGFPLWPEF